MSQAPRPPEQVARRRSLRWFLPVLVGLACFLGWARWQASQGVSAGDPATSPPAQKAADERIRAPELDGGVGWLNTSGPIHLKDLRGKIVVLDFWTYCCINCMHTLPDLAKLEKKYPDQVVVLGVHSAKFDDEKDSRNIRQAILRYQINHPVVNDADLKIWDAYGVRSWPTLCVIDPEGYYLGRLEGEGNYDTLDRVVARLIAIHRAKKTLNENPLHFDLARYHEPGDTPLFFPGKVLADAAGRRLFIADSTHHRIVITDLDGKKIAVAGAGEPGKADGPFARAAFNDPQGMALKGDLLYVADCKNHLIRALNLKARTVRTVAGTGEQDRTDRSQTGPPLKVGLNSPWDLYLLGNTLYIAMAGHHQIWALDLAHNEIGPFAGTGREDIGDGPLSEAWFAQPSGLSSDGNNLYVADAEVSAVRSIDLARGEVTTIVGEGLFKFGDVDGVGDKVRLQHALGVAYHTGKLYVADTYNSKIKVIDPAKRLCTTLLGERGGWLAGSLFNEPGGLSVAGDKLYVADTNAHRIRVIDLKTKAIKTLALQGVEAPKVALAQSRPIFPRPARSRLAETTVPADGELTLHVRLQLARGFHLNPQAKMAYVVEALPGARSAWSEIKRLPQDRNAVDVTVPAARVKGAPGVRLSLVYYECGEGAEAVCRIKSQIWDVPLKFEAGARNRVIPLTVSAATKDDKR